MEKKKIAKILKKREADNQPFTWMINEQASCGSGIEQFHEGVFERLVTAVLSGVRKPEIPSEILAHLPDNLVDIFHEYDPSVDIEPGHMVLLTTSESGGVKTESLGSLPKKHPLRDEVLLLRIGKPVNILITATKKEIERKEESHPHWMALICLDPAEIVPSVKILADLFKDTSDMPLVNSWLSERQGVILSLSGDHPVSTFWGDLLVEFVEGIDSLHRNRKAELNQFEIISKIQNAVAWELDQGRIFQAIEGVLRETIGFSYLELQILQESDGAWDSVASYQKNETDYGGQLLSLILKPKKQAEIIQSGKPLYVDSKNAKEVFANAKLLSLMMMKSGIILPLKNQDQVNGILKLFSISENYYTKQDATILESTSSMLSRSIDNARKHYIMHRMATVDGLTNVYNRRFFSEQLIREFNRAHRYKSQLSLIMIDIDHFKVFNDTNGHLAGDKVLSTVAQILKSNCRDADLVARYGGEEFAVILPETDLHKGLIVAEKIRSSVETHAFKFGEKQPGGKLTISLGVATKTDDVEEANDLINHADKALYRAKKKGRNCCVNYTDDKA